MEAEYNYTCPNCSQECSVPESLIGQNFTCPSCKVEFFATPPKELPPLEPQDPTSGFTPPAKLPFFESGRKKLLEQRFEELFRLKDGAMDNDAENELNKNGIVLGLDKNAGSALLKEHFLHEFEPIKRKMLESFIMTDEDATVIEQLERKYNIRIKAAAGGDLELLRAIYLLETRGTLPPPIQTGLMLNKGECGFR